MKKVIRNWIFLIIGVVLLSFWLFVSGRQHQVFISNGNRKTPGIQKIAYSMDGKKFKNIKSKKKKLELVKGKSHILIVKYKDEDNKEKSLEQEIKLGITENIEIFLPRLVNGEKNSIEKIK